MEGRLTLSDSSPDRSPEELLRVRMEHRVGAISLNVSFALTEPWTVLFGPSGSGKTTVLRAIAGFVRPDAGSIVRGESVLVDRAAHVFVPAHRRPVRSAGQTARLFPHMSVLENIGYAMDDRSKPDERRELIAEVLRLFRMNTLADRLPRELSGGEMQRVSVARAAASAVAYQGGRALLLLDEPFAGMDVQLKDELLAELRVWLAKRHTPVLSVTHDVGEAFQLGAEVIKIADGRVVRQGPVDQVLKDERSRLIEQLRER